MLPAYAGSNRRGKIAVNQGAANDADKRPANMGPAKMGPALHIDNVVKSYGPVRALDGVSFDVKGGEFIALLGPNGAGKSTLFQLLSGLFVPDAGRIEVMGHDMSRDPVPALAGLGIVFQQPTLDLELTVTANLMFHAGLHGMPRAQAQARIDDELKPVSYTHLTLPTNREV